MTAAVYDISMVSKRSRDLSQDQNERLRPVLKKLVDETKGGQVAVGETLGISQTTISGFLNGRQGTSLTVAYKICRLAKRDPAEVLGEVMPEQILMSSDNTVQWDVPALTFLWRVDRYPGLRRWLETAGTQLSVSQVARVLERYEETPPDAQSDGQPLGGWAKYFADTLSGQLERLDRVGTPEAAAATEAATISPAARKRLRTAAK